MQTLFDSGQFTPTNRTAAFQDVMVATGGSPHRIRFLTDQPTSIQARVSGLWLDRDVLLMRERSTGIVHERAEEHLRSAGPERIAFVLSDGGAGHYQHNGAERPLRRGELYVTDLNAAYTFHRPGTGTAHILQVERSRLEADVETIRLADQHLAHSSLYGVVRDHLASLSNQAPLLIDHQAHEATAEATVILLRGLVASVSPDDARRREAVHDHLLDRITLHLRLHATDPDLSTATIAAAHAISVRKLFQLWQSQPLPLSETIMQLRLEAAQRRPVAQRNLTVATVAHSCGFMDASHFCRRFRRALGCTPTEWRAQH